MSILSGPTQAVDISLEPYGKLPAFEMAALSPGGTRVAVVATLFDKRLLLVMDGSKLLDKIAIEDTKIDDLHWAGDDILLVGHRNTAALGLGWTAMKTELGSYSILSVQKEELRDVFAKNRWVTGGVRRFYGTLQKGNDVFGYFSGITIKRTNHSSVDDGYISTGQPDLYEVNLASGETTRLADHPESVDIYRDWAVSAIGQVAATLDYDSRNGNWKLFNAEGKQIQAGTTPNGNVDLLGLGRTPDKLVYEAGDVGTDAARFYEINQDGSMQQEIMTEPDARLPLFDPATHLMIGYADNAASSKRVYFDELKNKIANATRKAFPNLNASIEDSSRDFRTLLAYTDGIGDAGTWWTVNINTGKAAELGRVYLIPAKQVGPMRMVSYKAGDGLEMEGVLTLPPDKEPNKLPVIMLPHGGPFGIRDYATFFWWAQAFAAQGYAVFQPNFRGSGGYGNEFEKAGHGQWGRKMQTDISDGLAALVNQGIADPKRACIMGGSYGGYAALAGVTLQHGIYRCAVSVGGIGDLKALYGTDLSESGNNQTLRRNMQEEFGEYRNFDDVSPINFADRAEAPILLIHGKDDTVVHYSQSKDMAKALQKAGKNVALVTLEGEDHWLSKGITRLQMLKATSEFIRKYNPPD